MEPRFPFTQPADNSSSLQERAEATGRALIACNGGTDRSAFDGCVAHALAAIRKGQRVTLIVMDDTALPQKPLGERTAALLAHPLLNRPQPLSALAPSEPRHVPDADSTCGRMLITNPSLIHPRVSPYPLGLHTYHHWPKHLDGREASARTLLLQHPCLASTAMRYQASTRQRTTLLFCGAISLRPPCCHARDPGCARSETPEKTILGAYEQQCVTCPLPGASRSSSR